MLFQAPWEARVPTLHQRNAVLLLFPFPILLYLSKMVLHLACPCSLWDYTDVVMNYLCRPYTSDVSSSHNHKWLGYFDVVITGRLVCSNVPCLSVCFVVDICSLKVF